MSIEPTQHFEPIAEPGVTAYAVYADYDGNASDSSHVMLLSNRELAKAVLPIIAKDYDHLSVSDGWEWAKSWRIAETIARRGDVLCSLAEAQEWLAASKNESDD